MADLLEVEFAQGPRAMRPTGRDLNLGRTITGSPSGDSQLNGLQQHLDYRGLLKHKRSQELKSAATSLLMYRALSVLATYGQ